MKFFQVLCPRCGWSAEVDEAVAEEFRKLRYCQDCLKGNQVPPAKRVLYRIREKTRIFTNFLRGL